MTHLEDKEVVQIINESYTRGLCAGLLIGVVLLSIVVTFFTIVILKLA